MRRYWRVYVQFFVTSFKRELEFRANFIAEFLQSVVWVVFFLLIIKVIFGNTNEIAGWSEGEVYVLAATCIIIDGLSRSLYGHNLFELSDKVRRGTLDFDMIKPVDLMFLISFRKVSFSEIGSVLAGGVLVFVGVQMADSPITEVGVVFYLVAVACAMLIFYSFQLILMTLAIWLVKVENLWVLGETALSVARYPTEIFGPQLQRLFIYVLPMALLSWVPSKLLLGRTTGGELLLSVLWTVVMLSLARRFLFFSLKWYGSASS